MSARSRAYPWFRRFPPRIERLPDLFNDPPGTVRLWPDDRYSRWMSAIRTALWEARHPRLHVLDGPEVDAAAAALARYIDAQGVHRFMRAFFKPGPPLTEAMLRKAIGLK